VPRGDAGFGTIALPSIVGLHDLPEFIAAAAGVDRMALRDSKFRCRRELTLTDVQLHLDRLHTIAVANPIAVQPYCTVTSP
jgi:hypothetical protein